MDKLSEQILNAMNPEPPTTPAIRQNPAARLDHWTPAVLLERAAYLRKLAAQGDGSAGETLAEYPGHCAMLSFRSRSGMAEVHENFADLFYVLEGRATMVTGGTLAGARTTNPGEIRGDSVEGGARQEMRPGDVLHIPAGLPHQVLVAGENTITSMVFKIPENL